MESMRFNEGSLGGIIVMLRLLSVDHRGKEAKRTLAAPIDYGCCLGSDATRQDTPAIHGFGEF
jgi:hypothetical protein